MFPALGAAYGTAKSGTGISAMAVMKPELIMKSVIPVVMAGIIAIYGLVVAVVIIQDIPSTDYTLYKLVIYYRLLYIIFTQCKLKSFTQVLKYNLRPNLVILMQCSVHPAPSLCKKCAV